MKLILGILLALFGAAKSQSNSDALAFLDQISSITPENCDGGADNAIDLPLNYAVWEECTRTARLTSNYMTAYLNENGGSVDGLSDEFYYRFIKNNIAGQTKIFASSITLEPGLHPVHHLFSPYAFLNFEGGITALDLSQSYDYRTPATEWWNVPKNKVYNDILEVHTTTTMKGSNNAVEETLLVATRKDGHWTKAYFDCGGGDIWLTTHSSPIFYRGTSGNPIFKGVGYIDKDLSSIDINQCDAEDGDTGESDPFFGIFRGTHKCPANSECQPKTGAGLKRGSYYCSCKKGYYYPHTSSVVKAFDGEDIEDAAQSGGDMSNFQCLPCSAGCDACIDDKTCLWPIGYKHGKRRYKKKSYRYGSSSSSSSSSKSSSSSSSSSTEYDYNDDHQTDDHHNPYPYQYPSSSSSSSTESDYNDDHQTDDQYPYQYYHSSKYDHRYPYYYNKHRHDRRADYV